MKAILSLLLTVVASSLTLSGAEEAAKGTRPNILWIVIDDVGLELSCYGEQAIQTPNMDRLAREGTRFTRAFLTAPVCSTARSAMITGMYQTSIGAQNHQSGRGAAKIQLPDGVEPVPALFQRAGYYTCNGGFPLKPNVIGKTDYNFEWDSSIYHGGDWSGRKPGQPFFAQIQLWGGKHRDNARWHRDAAARELGTLTDPAKVELPPYYPRDPVLLEDWAQYLDAIRYTDRQVGQILDRLEAEGVLDETIIILMGDNGISHARGKQFLYDEGIRTPFMVRGPGIARGAVRDDLIEHIDMAATSLAFAGLPVPASMQGRDIFAKDYRRREAVFAARDRCGETVDCIRSVRTERFKYIRNFYPDRPLLQPSNYKDTKPIIRRLRELHAEGKLNALQEELLFAPSRPPEELYDVRVDPFETVNLADDPRHASALKQLRARLEQWSRETGDPPPESAALYDLEMRYQVGKTRDPVQKAAVIQNVELMRRWAMERPLRLDLPQADPASGP